MKILKKNKLKKIANKSYQNCFFSLLKIPCIGKHALYKNIAILIRIMYKIKITAFFKIVKRKIFKIFNYNNIF